MTATTWTCDHCKKPIKDGHGYVYVDKNAAWKCKANIKTWKAENPGPFLAATALMDYPRPARWIVTHGDCDHVPNGNDYSLNIENMRTHADLIRRTAHLMGKSWFEHTDWEQILYRAVS